MLFPRTLSRCRLRPGLAAILVASGIPVLAPAEIVLEPSMTLTRESIRLEASGQAYYAYGLAAGAELVFAVRASRWHRDALRLLLLDEQNYEKLVTGEPFDYYTSGSGMTKRAARFAFAAPRQGNYYVILDNSGSGSPVDLAVYAYANLPEPSEKDLHTKGLYQALYDDLASLIEFDEIDISIRRCGRVNAFSTPSIVICTEFEELMAASDTPGVRLFVLMHEVAHNFLYQWGYKSIYRDQFMTDRLAATLIELMDRETLAAGTAEWFASHEPITGPSGFHAPFTMSRRRAERIAEWLNDDDQLDLSWTKRIVFPRLHTTALESMLQRADLRPRTLDRVAAELERRKQGDGR